MGIAKNYVINKLLDSDKFVQHPTKKFEDGTVVLISSHDRRVYIRPHYSLENILGNIRVEYYCAIVGGWLKYTQEANIKYKENTTIFQFENNEEVFKFITEYEEHRITRYEDTKGNYWCEDMGVKIPEFKSYFQYVDEIIYNAIHKNLFRWSNEWHEKAARVDDSLGETILSDRRNYTAIRLGNYQQSISMEFDLQNHIRQGKTKTIIKQCT